MTTLKLQKLQNKTREALKGEYTYIKKQVNRYKGDAI